MNCVSRIKNDANSFYWQWIRFGIEWPFGYKLMRAKKTLAHIRVTFSERYSFSFPLFVSVSVSASHVWCQTKWMCFSWARMTDCVSFWLLNLLNTIACYYRCLPATDTAVIAAAVGADVIFPKHQRDKLTYIESQPLKKANAIYHCKRVSLLCCSNNKISFNCFISNCLQNLLSN